MAFYAFGAIDANGVAASRAGRCCVEWMKGKPTANAVGDSCDGRRGPSDARLRAKPQTKAVRRYTVANRIPQDVCQCCARRIAYAAGARGVDTSGARLTGSIAPHDHLVARRFRHALCCGSVA